MAQKSSAYANHVFEDAALAAGVFCTAFINPKCMIWSIFCPYFMLFWNIMLLCYYPRLSNAIKSYLSCKSFILKTLYFQYSFVHARITDFSLFFLNILRNHFPCFSFRRHSCRHILMHCKINLFTKIIQRINSLNRVFFQRENHITIKKNLQGNRFNSIETWKQTLCW